MVVITAVAVIFISRSKKSEKTEPKPDTEVTITPEKQLVQPDDVIEEAIIGDNSQEVVGTETIIM
jgi:hypothetical protein